MEDWRLSLGQEEYLSGLTFRKESFLSRAQDLGFHKHCALCWTTLSPCDGDEHEGYVSENGQYWLCRSCFRKFRKALMLMEAEP